MKLYTEEELNEAVWEAYDNGYADGLDAERLAMAEDLAAKGINSNEDWELFFSEPEVEK